MTDVLRHDLFVVIIIFMKIIFEIDPKYDKQCILTMLRKPDWKYRAKEMDLPLNLVEKLNKAEGKDLKKAERELDKIVKATYKKFGQSIKKACTEYQRSWNKIIDEFSETVGRLSVPWFYPEYVVKVTHFNPGISNWNGNVVGRWWKEDYDKQRRITAHEILLAHFFSIHRNLYKDSGLTDRQIWALAEIFAFAMTGLEPQITKFWPWDESGYYTNHNYPDIVDLQNELREPFLKRKSFDEYVKKGIELVCKFNV